MSINSNNFDLKSRLIQMACDLAFRGHPTKDPYKHLQDFPDISEVVKINKLQMML